MLLDELLHGTASSLTLGILTSESSPTAYIMSAQLHNRGSSSSNHSTLRNWNTVFIERNFEETVLRLLTAPTVDDKPMWISQAFDFARDNLRGKISDIVSTDNVIAVICEHFSVSTMASEQEARRFIRCFRAVFVDVTNIASLSIY